MSNSEEEEYVTKTLPITVKEKVVTPPNNNNDNNNQNNGGSNNNNNSSNSNSNNNTTTATKSGNAYLKSLQVNYEGLTPNYIRVVVKSDKDIHGEILKVKGDGV